MLPLSPVTVIVPVILPAAEGVTATDRVPDCPAARAIGNVVPERLNCEFENVACVIFTPTVPVFETETLCVLFFPTVTVPKFTLAGFSWNSAAIVCEVALTIPAHPFNRAREEIRRNRAKRHVEMRCAEPVRFIWSVPFWRNDARRVTPRPRHESKTQMETGVTGESNKRRTGTTNCT